MDEHLRSNYSNIFGLIVRRVTILINLSLLRMLIKIATVPIRAVDLDSTTCKLEERKKWNKKEEKQKKTLKKANKHSTQKQARKEKKKKEKIK